MNRLPHHPPNLLPSARRHFDSGRGLAIAGMLLLCGIPACDADVDAKADEADLASLDDDAPSAANTVDLQDSLSSIGEALELAGYRPIDMTRRFSEPAEYGGALDVVPVEFADAGFGVDILFPDGEREGAETLLLRPWTDEDARRIGDLDLSQSEPDVSPRVGGKYYTGCVYISKVGFNAGCIDFGGNPFGYYVTKIGRVGYSYKGPPSLYSWYADWQGKAVVCPYEQTAWNSYSFCGYP